MKHNRIMTLASLICFMFIAITSQLLGKPVHATSYTWTGAGGDNNWSTCANWGGTCPATGDTVTFNGTSTKDSVVDTSFGGSVGVLNISSGYTGTVSLARSLLITSTMTQAAGTFTAGTNELTVTSTFTLSNGTFNAPSSTMYAKGNFARTGGTFNHNSGTVNLNGNNQTISGSTTFYNLTKANNGYILTVTAGTTQTITHVLTLSGRSPISRLFLRSSVNDSVWNIELAGATSSVSNVDVKDCVATGTALITADTGSVDAGNNTGWSFPGYQLPQKTIDMADSNNWNIRFDGPNSFAFTSTGTLQTADLFGTGHQDIIFSAPAATFSYDGTSSVGSIYIISYSIYSKITGKGQVVDLTNPQNYTLRIDGPPSSPGSGLGAFGEVKASDLNGDGKLDLITASSRTNYNGRSDSGSVFVLYNDLLRQHLTTPTGNVMYLAHTNGDGDFDQFNLRFDGPYSSASSLVALGQYIGVGNISQTGHDLVMVALNTGFNGYSSGSVYIVSGSLLRGWSGTGNTIDLTTSTNYSLRIDGAHEASARMGNYLSDTVGDLNNNGKDDLIIGTGSTTSTTGNAYILYDSLLTSKLSLVGQTLDLGDPSGLNYNIVIHGEQNGDGFGQYGPYTITDLNHDGKKWLILAGAMTTSHNSKNQNGSVYLIPYTLLSQYSGTGNSLNLSDTTSYFARIDGADDQHWLGDMFTTTHDYFGLGRNDILAGSPKSPSVSTGIAGPSDWGQVYVISNSLINTQPNATGNVIDLANSSNYVALYQGAPISTGGTAGTHFIAAMTDTPSNSDLNNDGTHDLLFSAHYNSYTNGSKSGSIYVVYNFPHTISISKTSVSNNVLTVTGKITATDSVTTVSKVQYSLDNNSPSSSTWKNCQGTTSYTCTLSVSSWGNHILYIRARDSNGSYTVKSMYKTVHFTLSRTGITTTLTPTNPTPSVTETIIPTEVITVEPTPSSTSVNKPTIVVTNNQKKFTGICFGVFIVLILLLLILLLSRRKRDKDDSK